MDHASETTMSRKFTGGCYCGAIRYESTKSPVTTGMCHCRMCQRWTGMAAGTGAFFDLDSFRFTKGEPARFMTSPILERHFCPECGTHIGHSYAAGDMSNLESIFIGTLDEPLEIESPSFYFGVEDHLAGWIQLQEGVPQVRADSSPHIKKAFEQARSKSGDG